MKQNIDNENSNYISLLSSQRKWFCVFTSPLPSFSVAKNNLKFNTATITEPITISFLKKTVQNQSASVTTGEHFARFIARSKITIT